MGTSRQEFEMWLNLPRENEGIEFKEKKNTCSTDEVMDYSVAIANEGGGKLVLGVTNKVPRRVVGTHAFENIQDIEGKIFERLKFRVVVEEMHHDDGRVLIFHIPSRPKGQAYAHDGRHLMRIGDAVHVMSEDQLRAIYNEGKPEWLEEVAKHDVAEEEVFDLLDIDIFFRLAGRRKPQQKDIIDEFTHLKIVKESGGAYDITNLGAVVLARKLDDFDLSGKAPRVIAYAGTSKTEGAKKDICGTKGYAVGFEGLRDFIDFFIPDNEVFGKALRTSMKMYGDRSIRELLANALIHQDFSISGCNVMVEIYPDRIEIFNPGKPLIPEDRFLDSVRARNEQLARIMRLLKIGEGRGFGIDEVFTEAEVFQLPAPDFIQNEVGTTAILFAHRGWDAMLPADKIRACYQHCGLKYVMRQEYMTNTSLRGRFRLPASETDVISILIRDTLEARLIKVVDPHSGRKFRRYVPYWAG